ncbi:hypothetical protein [Teichococcus rhizosphaerae]|uniref:hypothetical protein n=1 Tax=Teichococcus rhizosphaerae TaxID=1335062 RepID=UPI00114600EE|nr:hypothetical protein [Pseudoroseomonas rhizosphaerae]
MGALSLGMAGMAVAQPAPPVPPPAAEAGPATPGSRPEGRPWGRGPQGGPQEGRWGMMHGPHHLSSGSSFSFRRGDTSVRIHCSDKEPVQACVSAANGLFDKFNAVPR